MTPTPMFFTRPLVLAASACLAACTPMQWVKPGADAALLSEDAAQCRQQAQREARMRGWTFRPTVPIVVRGAGGGRFVFWQRDNFFDPYGDQFMEEYRLTNFCLRVKGYELVPVPKSEVSGDALFRP